MAKTEVRAAGCIVWRRIDGTVQIAVVHRDRYDDWSHPKGKRDKGEDDLTCAVREVEEETGFRGSIHRELPVVRYVDHKGRPKTVRYWSMEYVGGQFEPNDEVDEVRWVTPDEAAGLLSYEHDRDLLDVELFRI